jgi:hypothetical protein
MAGVGVGGVVLALSVRSSAISGNGGAPRPPHGRLEAAGKGPALAGIGLSVEAKGVTTVRPVAAPAAPSEPPATQRTEGARPAETAPPAKVRRIEDLPAATPVAYRPLRVEELPQAPPTGAKSKRGKAAAAQPLRIEDLPSISDAVRPLRPDEMNPELVKRADDLLWNHPAPVGVDVPFEVNGKNYIARFALHYHEFGSDKKPWGYHKGVTIYSTWE